MNQSEAQSFIKSQIKVTRQQVIIAESFVLSNYDKSTENILRNFLQSLGIVKPEKVVFHRPFPLDSQILEVINDFSWRLSFSEAIWGLIHNNILIQHGPTLIQIALNQERTTVVKNSGGTSSGWRFDEFEIYMPREAMIAPSVIDNLPRPLADLDIYMTEFDIPNLHPEVEDALRQAILCLKHELNVPCLAMLAKASEGAWIETGNSLLKYSEFVERLSKTNQTKLEKPFASPYESIVAKMDKVEDLYNKRDIFVQMVDTDGMIA
ncbi:MAG: hypothetical protein JW762_06070 [Dehalococcoidales bacterium]|nr:hypothetical protein [Dehalococcoidales bacterium]